MPVQKRIIERKKDIKQVEEKKQIIPVLKDLKLADCHKLVTDLSEALVEETTKNKFLRKKISDLNKTIRYKKGNYNFIFKKNLQADEVILTLKKENEDLKNEVKKLKEDLTNAVAKGLKIEGKYIEAKELYQILLLYSTNIREGKDIRHSILRNKEETKYPIIKG